MNPINALNNKVVLAQKTVSLRGNLSVREKQILKRFKGATEEDWNDWHWQLCHRIRDKATLSKFIHLTPWEAEDIEQTDDNLTMSIPPYFLSLMDPVDPACPVRRQGVSTILEQQSSLGEMIDPCGEEKHSPVHGLVHRYPDRVLFLVSEMCAMYCRHCTRSRMVGEGKRSLGSVTYEKAFDYIRQNKQVRDVLISGGDPLMLADSRLENILKAIKSIAHVEFVRIGTRMPVTLPQRVTGELVSMLKKYSPLWISLHVNHPAEITGRVKTACDLLSDNGFPLGSQTVLLKGINDNSEVMKKLMHKLLKIRVRPYYIYQCDPIVGSKHFRTSLTSGMKIMEALRGFTTGYAVPTFVVDVPGGGGKVPISPDYVVSRHDGRCVLRNYEGQEYVHYDP
ncbi:MAG: KamA family radical SAM protein [Candidatus Omnitrophica bacterium]|nr:KamA family radical SAM protein [Candidatus Omnitrophota bacterium]